MSTISESGDETDCSIAMGAVGVMGEGEIREVLATFDSPKLFPAHVSISNGVLIELRRRSISDGWTKSDVFDSSSLFRFCEDELDAPDAVKEEDSGRGRFTPRTTWNDVAFPDPYGIGARADEGLNGKVFTRIVCPLGEESIRLLIPCCLN